MSKQQRISIRPVEKDEPDLRRLARAIIDLVIEEQSSGQQANEREPAQQASPADGESTSSRSRDSSEGDRRRAA